MAFYIFLSRLLGYFLSLPGQGGASAREKKRRMDGDEMVQDPQCKVYVPLDRALERKVGGQTLYFCSEDCAKKYVKEIK